MKFRKGVYKGLSSALICGSMVMAIAGPALADVKDVSGHWAQAQITKWVDKGYISGYADGTFKPNNSITRAEFMTLVNKSFGFTEEASINYKDVSSNQWFYQEVAKAKAVGYISGYADGTIKPNNKITRQEAAVIISKLLKLSPVSEDKLSSFLDASSIAPWGKEFVEEVVGQGIMHGYPDKTFKPNNNITRAESVFTLDEALNSQSTDNGNTSTTGDSISTTTPSTGSTGGGGGSSSGGSGIGSSSSGSSSSGTPIINNSSSSSTITYNSGSINRTSFAGITTVQITGPVSFGSTSLIPSYVTVVMTKGASLTGPGTIAGTLNMVDDPNTSLNNVTVTGQTNIIAQ